MKRGWGGGGMQFDFIERTVTCDHGRQEHERCPWCTPLPSTAETRHEAEVAIEPSKENLRKKVLDCIAAHPQGVTDEKISDLTGMPGNTERPRRKELERAGKITARGTGKTRSGRKAVTWVIA